MSEADRQRWNEKWAERTRSRRVNRLLLEHHGLLGGGRALDLACGRGQNSIWLARHGYTTLGVDVSGVALRAARAAAAREGVWRYTLFVQADLDRWRPPAETFNLVAVFRFLDRDLYEPLKGCVLPGGLLFYETRHEGILERLPDANPAYLLRRDELRQVFSGWQMIDYREGPENAGLVARKPCALSLIHI